MARFSLINRLDANPQTATRNRNRLADLIREAGISRIEDLTHDHAQDFLVQMQDDGKADKTIRVWSGTFHKFLTWCHAKGYVDARHTAQLTIPPKTARLPVYLSETEIARAKAIADEQGILCEVTLALNTGLRMNELRNLEWNKVDLRTKHIFIRGDIAKNRSPRKVPLNPSALSVLWPQYERFGGLCYVFPGGKPRRGKAPLWNEPRPRSEDWWKKTALQEIQAAVPSFRQIQKGSTGRGWHLFRHTFASHAVMRGVPIFTLQKWLGHKSIASTMIYAHYDPEWDPDIEKVSL